MNIDDRILSHLVLNPEYGRKVLPFLKEEYFASREDRILFNLASNYIQTYNNFPTKEVLFIDLTNLTGINEGTFKDVQGKISSIAIEENTDLKWLLDKTEEFCKQQSLKNALFQSIGIWKGEDKTLDKGSIPKLLQDALGVSFDTHIGHDFIEEWEQRYDYIHTLQKRVPFDLDSFNKITKNGFATKTLNMFVAGTHVGKAQPLSTRIPTPYGWKTFSDLKVGDFVFGSDGNFTKILGVFPQGTKDIYELTFEDGRTSRCCIDHLWNVYDFANGWKTLSLSDIIQKRGSNKKFRDRTYIPQTKPVNYVAQDLRVDPYLMGALLGDRSFQKGDPISYNKIRKMLEFYGLMNLKSHKKFIPKPYLRGSIEQRFALLQGLMDTDGTIGGNLSVQYSTTSQQLASDVSTLIRSLGGKVKVTSKVGSYKCKKTRKLKECRMAYYLSIEIPASRNIFSLPRKAEQFAKRTDIGLNLRVVDIRKVGSEECMCIRVDAADSLYLTDEYIVTHNTLIMTHFASNNLAMGYNVLYITLEMGEIGDPSISQRIDANLLDIPINDLSIIPRETFYSRITKLKAKTQGKLIIKEYPTATVGASHFRFLLNELNLKKNFKPDIIYIDYLNLCVSSRYRNNSKAGMYEHVKAVAEELRGLAQEYEVPIVSASQLNRAGFVDSDAGMEHIAESWGLSHTADFLAIVFSSEEMQRLNQYVIKQAKNRYDNIAKMPKFVIGVDKDKMRLYDVDDSAQTLIQDKATPVMDNTNFIRDDGPKVSMDTFKDWK